MFDDPRDNDRRDRNDEWRERELDLDSRERIDDPRDVFVRELNLPRDRQREVVVERHHAYELNGNDSRTLATVGVFRIVSERELSKHQVDHLRGEGLIQKVSIDLCDRGVVLSSRRGDQPAGSAVRRSSCGDILATVSPLQNDQRIRGDNWR